MWKWKAELWRWLFYIPEGRAQRRNADYGCSDNRLLYLHTIDPATCMKRGREVER